MSAPNYIPLLGSPLIRIGKNRRGWEAFETRPLQSSINFPNCENFIRLHSLVRLNNGTGKGHESVLYRVLQKLAQNIDGICINTQISWNVCLYVYMFGMYSTTTQRISKILSLSQSSVLHEWHGVTPSLKGWGWRGKMSTFFGAWKISAIPLLSRLTHFRTSSLSDVNSSTIHQSVRCTWHDVDLPQRRP